MYRTPLLIITLLLLSGSANGSGGWYGVENMEYALFYKKMYNQNDGDRNRPVFQLEKWFLPGTAVGGFDNTRFIKIR